MPRIVSRDRALGVAALAGALLAWGIGGPMFKTVRTSTSLLRLSWRGQSSVVFMTAPLARELSRREEARKPSRETMSGILAVGTSMFVMFVGWNYGVDATAFTHVAIFSQIHPVVIMLYAAARAKWDGGERFPTLREWLGVLVTFAGVVTTATARGTASQRRPPTVWGDLVSLTCGVAGAVYALSIRKWFGPDGVGIPRASGIYVQTMGAIVMTVYSFLCLACVPGQVWASSTPPYTRGVFDWPKSPDLWPGVVSIGSLAIIGHTFVTVAMQYLPLIVVSLSLTMTPVVQTLFAWLFIDDDAPTPQAVAGSSLIIAGIVYTMISENRAKLREEGGGGGEMETTGEEMETTGDVEASTGDVEETKGTNRE